MNVVFVSHCDFLGNSAMHIFSLANELSGLGVASLVCVPGDPETVSGHGRPAFRVAAYDDAVEAARFPDGRGPDLVHAWTPRESVRRVAEPLARRFAVPCIVHLEDNEELLLEDSLGGAPFARLSCLPAALQDQLVPTSRYHPRHGARFLASAAGVTALMDRLLEAAPARAPRLVFWPGYDDAFDRGGADGAFRGTIGVAPDAALLVYTGNVHASNLGEVSSLVFAVAALRRRGHAVTLAKTGTNFVPVPLYDEGIKEGFVVDLGFLPREDVPRLVHDADVLVQPGRPGRFNDYRFPSKLPEFLVSGRPVVLPRTNIGRFLEDGVECVLLHEGHALEIAARVEPLLGDPARRERIGAAGRSFARRELRWPKAAAALRELYDEVAGGARRSATPAAGEASAPPAPGDAAAASEAAVGSPEAMEATGPSAASGVSAAPDRAPGEVPCHSRWPVRLIAVTGSPAPPQAGGLEARRYGIEGVGVLWRCRDDSAERFADAVAAAVADAACPTVGGAPVVLVDDAGRVPEAVVARWRELWAARGLPDVHLVCCRPGRAAEGLPAGFDAVAAPVPDGLAPAHVLYPLVTPPAGSAGGHHAAGSSRLRAHETAVRRAVEWAATRSAVQAPLVLLDAAGGVQGVVGPAGADRGSGRLSAAGRGEGALLLWDEVVLAATRRAWSGGMQQHFARLGLPLTEKMMVDALVAAGAVPSRSPAVTARPSGGPDDDR